MVQLRRNLRSKQLGNARDPCVTGRSAFERDSPEETPPHTERLMRLSAINKKREKEIRRNELLKPSFCSPSSVGAHPLCNAIKEKYLLLYKLLFSLLSEI